MAKSAFPVVKKFPKPKGWFLAGDTPDGYETSIDKSVAHSGTQYA